MSSLSLLPLYSLEAIFLFLLPGLESLCSTLWIRTGLSLCFWNLFPSSSQSLQIPCVEFDRGKYPVFPFLSPPCCMHICIELQWIRVSSPSRFTWSWLSSLCIQLWFWSDGHSWCAAWHQHWFFLSDFIDEEQLFVFLFFFIHLFLFLKRIVVVILVFCMCFFFLVGLEQYREQYLARVAPSSKKKTK